LIRKIVTVIVLLIVALAIYVGATGLPINR
jgi:hypothetical protein